MDWRNLLKQSVTVGAQLLRGGRYGCNNGRYGCTIVISYIEINKAVSQWLLPFNLCVSVTWPLTCAFHIPCAHTPEIIDMHRGVCDNMWYTGLYIYYIDMHRGVCDNMWYTGLYINYRSMNMSCFIVKAVPATDMNTLQLNPDPQFTVAQYILTFVSSVIIL